MADIQYCDDPLDGEWSLSPDVTECRLDASQSEIDEWVKSADAKWYAKDLTVAEGTAVSLEERFREHASKWERDTAYLSATPMIVMHESYQSIIAMGPDVIPVLLRDLEKTHRHWFWALRHLTGQDPVLPSDRGNVGQMIKAWIKWGKSKGRI